ncbi:MAG: XdhC/CoxI family protein [Treponema sp.]|nr:XdhC/CoxI family protein [Treponema sp.]
MYIKHDTVKELLQLIKERLSKNEPLVLVTVTQSSGSVPRGAGARMLVGKGKYGAGLRLWGSIGGGITEHRAIAEAGSLLLTHGTAFSKYTLHSDDAAEVGARCGGEISVSFRFIDTRETELLEELEKQTASDSIVYVFGGGHIAQELVPLLAHLGFRCVVFDDREEFSKPNLFPGAEKVIRGDFEHIEKNISLTEKDYAVVVTRGHRWDLEAWAFALNSPAAYIGVIGSKTKHEFVKEQLQKRGFGSDAINAARVHAPIGVDIKSETPAEIAVSIAAELILCRAQVTQKAGAPHNKI